MLRDRYARILEKQGIQMKRFGIYLVVILLVFALFIFFTGKITIDYLISAEENTSPTVTENITEPVEDIEKKTEKEKAVDKLVGSGTPVNSDEKIKVEQPAAVTSITKIIWPMKGKVIKEMGLSYSQTFSDYRYHEGIDIEGKRGTEVVVCMSGVVKSVESSKAFRNKIVIDHGNGWCSVYAHVEEVYVKEGQWIKEKTKLGSIGQPGLAEVLEGPHLHFCLVKGNDKKNPLDYLPK